MDLAYLRAHPQHLQTFLTHQRLRETPVGGGSICEARRLTLEDGASVFAKSVPDGQPVPAGFFEAEANGLRWLAEAGGAPAPEVLVQLPNLLALAWLDPAPPGPSAAERFGRELAALHRAGAADYGAPWPGYIGLLTQDNSGGTSWPDWFASHRLVPYLRRCADIHALSPDDVAVIDRLVRGLDRFDAPAEGPSRLHGDLWSGNLVWTADQVWLVDPAAHGGHRETDLAQLALFGGAPHLDRILGAYRESWPLATGWRDRVPLHQLHLLLVHAAMFGPGYREAVMACARAVQRS